MSRVTTFHSRQLLRARLRLPACLGPLEHVRVRPASSGSEQVSFHGILNPTQPGPLGNTMYLTRQDPSLLLHFAPFCQGRPVVRFFRFGLIFVFFPVMARGVLFFTSLTSSAHTTPLGLHSVRCAVFEWGHSDCGFAYVDSRFEQKFSIPYFLRLRARGRKLPYGTFISHYTTWLYRVTSSNACSE